MHTVTGALSTFFPAPDHVDKAFNGVCTTKAHRRVNIQYRIFEIQKTDIRACRMLHEVWMRKRSIR